jgi:hypothetical protein
MQDLKELIARVEGASGPDRELDRLVALAVSGATEDRDELGGLRGYHKDGFWTSIGPIEPVTASLDAALSLLERVLPEAYAGVQQNRYEPGEAGDRTWNGYVFLNDEEHESLKHPTPALALVLAILKALSTENDDGR